MSVLKKRVNSKKMDISIVCEYTLQELKDSHVERLVIKSADDEFKSVDIAPSEMVAYMERNNLSKVSVVKHQFPDDYKAFCLDLGNHEYVEVNQIPYINVQNKVLATVIPTPMQI